MTTTKKTSKTKVDVSKISTIAKRTKLQTRPYQLRIVAKAVDMFRGRHLDQSGEVEKNARSLMIESPTGSGKTVMGFLTAKALQLELAADGDKLAVVWVAMRRNLLTQAEDENIKHDINVKDLHMLSMFDSDISRLLKLKESGYKLLIVVDEAQHDAASSMAHIHNTLVPDFILGLSATPFRTDRVKLCFDKVIKDAGIHQLISDGWLSQYDHYSIDNWKPATVAATYLAEPERWGKSIMYFVNLAQCFECYEIVRAAGVPCQVVTGDSDIDEQLALFKSGEIKLLINCMKLTEGFDAPDLMTAFVRDSGKGPTMQMGGRVFRKHESAPVKQIVQSKNTKWPMLRTALPVQQQVWQDGGWVSLTINPKINQINDSARMAIAAAVNVELPKFILDRKPKKKPLRFN